MTRRLAYLIVLTGCVVAAGSRPSLRAAPRSAGAPELIAQAIGAMGGEARLTGLRSLALNTVGHNYALEQSERPEGPWLTIYSQVSEVRDFEHKRIMVRTQRRSWASPDWSPAIISVSLADARASHLGTRWIPTPPTTMDTALALDPERLLLTARAAADLRLLPDELQQKIDQNVLGFTWQGMRMRLLLNPWTHLPTMLERVVDDQLYRLWGDVTERRWYSFWTLEKGGLLYPRQTTTEWNGLPLSDFTVQQLSVDGVVDEGQFAIPDDVKAASAAAATAPPRPPTALDESKAIAVSDHIVELPGGFNVSLVRQPDGIVVIEGTTTTSYSADVLAFAAKRFPGVPVKALVTTSDAWPHIAGIREYVARGIPIYPLDLNVSILSRVAAAPHTIAPDGLARQPRAPIFKPVSGRTVIGAGDTRIELIPVRGETGERMMIAWMPGAHVVYSSDLIQHDRGSGFFMPEMLMEVQAALAREHITGVERVFGMHLTPTPWSEVEAAIAAAQR